MIENINQHKDLTRLKKYLNYELSSSTLFLLSFMVAVFIFLASAAAVIFTPFMLNVLYKENRKGWILFFVIIVIVPFTLFIILGLAVEFSRPLILITLGLFYFYCFLLRFEVNNWVKEINARNQYLYEKKKSEDELNTFTNQFD